MVQSDGLIFLVNEEQLDEGQAEFVREYFRTTVLPELEPILLTEARAFGHLTDESIYLAVDIKSGEDYSYALVEVPTDRLDRFSRSPRRDPSDATTRAACCKRSG